MLNINSKLSVVIPCFNKSKYLIELVDCIQRQTFTNWELFLVDDGSSIEEYELVHEYVSTDTRIKHIKRNREPKNGNTCRNIGMALASGEYLMIFDSDDLISDTCFENRVKFLNENPDIDYASFPTASFDTDNFKYKVARSYNPNETDILGRLLSANYPFTVWANIYRCSSLKNIFWDENVYVYQDFDFMLNCAVAGLKHSYSLCSKADYYYRLFNDGSNVCGEYVSEQKRISTLKLFDKTLKIVNNLPNAIRLKNCFLKFIAYQLERLIKGNCYEDVEKLYSILIPYYEKEIRNIPKLTSEYKNASNRKIAIARLHWRLYSNFSMKIYRTYFMHDVAKIILGR